MKTLPQNLLRQNDKFPSNNCETTESHQESFPFFVSPVSGKKVQLDFNGGSVTSNAGVLLLSETERRLGIIDSVVDCIPDKRRPYSVEHSLKELVSQRVFSRLRRTGRIISP